MRQAARSVPGTRCVARADASKQAAKSVPAKSVPGTRCVCPNGAQGDSPGQSEAPPWVWYATKVACPERAEQADKSVPGTRCDKSVPGTRCSETSRCQAPGAGLLARSDASKQAVKSVQRSNQCQAQGTAVPGTRCGARSMLANMRPKSVRGTRCGAGADASK